MISGWIIVSAVIILCLLASIKILREYERGVVFRWGRVLPQAKGPGTSPDNQATQ
jgi:regulator of protease activity HflC (stomatin/prohibitin superfamily)